MLPAATSPQATATSNWLEEQVGTGVEADTIVDARGVPETKVLENKITPATIWPSRIKPDLNRVIVPMPPHSDLGLLNLENTSTELTRDSKYVSRNIQI
jgi:hypothetical protein